MDKKILIVDDESTIREALREKLGHEGFHIFEAEDGKQGLQIALAQHPDLMLVDIIMPQMDGVAMVKKLREDNWGKDAKIIMLTNLSDQQKFNESMKSEVTDFLIKSDYKLEDLIKKINQMLS